MVVAVLVWEVVRLGRGHGEDNGRGPAAETEHLPSPGAEVSKVRQVSGWLLHYSQNVALMEIVVVIKVTGIDGYPSFLSSEFGIEI